MSQNSLRKLVKDIIDGSAVQKILHVSSYSTKGFRETLNRKLHILLVNESILSTVAPEAINILKDNLQYINKSLVSSGKALGADGNATAIQLILAQYHKYRNKKKGDFRTKSFTLNDEKTYRLIFKNFTDVRNFLNTIGFYSRPMALVYIFENYKDILNETSEILGISKEDILNLPIAGSSDTIMSLIASLSRSKNKEAKELYSKINSLADPISYDVGHNTPVQYEALEIIAQDENILKELLDGFMSGIYKTEAEYKAKVLKQGSKIRGTSVLSTSLTKSALNEENISKLMHELSRELNKAVLSLDLVTHKKVHSKNSAVSGEFVFTFPERTSGNQGKLENALTDILIQRIAKYLVTNKVISQQFAFSESSPSIINIIENNLVSKLTGKKIKQGIVVDSSTTNNIKAPLPVSAKNNTKINKNSVSISTKPKNNVSSPLRNIQGQFTSVTKLDGLLRAGLTKTIIKNMQRPNLRNQTGRFAESVELQSLSRARDGSLQAFLTYMRYPYATFEKGGKQGRKGYYPSRLIDQSVRELATTLVKERMKVIVQ